MNADEVEKLRAENARLKATLRSFEDGSGEAAVAELAAAQAENARITESEAYWRNAAADAEASLAAVRKTRNDAMEMLESADAENARLSAEVERVLSLLLVAHHHRDLGSTKAYPLEAEARSALALLLGCGCIETYPQLRPGALCHAPGCRRASDKSAVCQPAPEAKPAVCTKCEGRGFLTGKEAQAKGKRSIRCVQCVGTGGAA